MRISARLLKKTLTHTDERAKVEGELLDGMDVVKCMTWEVSSCQVQYNTHVVIRTCSNACQGCCQLSSACEHWQQE